MTSLRTDAPQFLLLHGYTGSGSQHWQSWLAERLSVAGHSVRFPSLPNPDSPEIEEWLAALRAELDALDPTRLVVLAHSCGSSLWLHYAAVTQRRAAKRVLLVSPPGPRWREPSVKGFLPVPRSEEGVRRASDETQIVATRNDPYCTEAELEDYARTLRVDLTVLPEGGHLNTASGYGPWPAVERWALTSAPLSRGDLPGA